MCTQAFPIWDGLTKVLRTKRSLRKRSEGLFGDACELTRCLRGFGNAKCDYEPDFARLKFQPSNYRQARCSFQFDE